MTYAFDPDFAEALAVMPKLDVSDIHASRNRSIETFALVPLPDATGVDVREELVPGPDGAPDVRLLVYTPHERRGPAAIYDVHGGGFILGWADQDAATNLKLARDLGVVVVAVDYRLAPETPFPGGLEDCYAGLIWMVKHADTLGIDPDRIALHGISAGGGLCAGLALLARDRGGPAIAFQFLAIPEVDDRLATPSMTAFIDTPIWNRPNAIVSWAAYLAPLAPGAAEISHYAAPARATDLAGLPPAYISVMQYDPLRDEGVAYALGMLAAGVQVELHLYPGTFHGSSLVPTAAVSKRELGEKIAVLGKALGVS